MMSDDDGLFGPGSATWHLMGEPILWVAGIRALYLQALHPRTMCGTWQNSALVHRHETWARFVRTTEFVRIRTYGSTEEAERIGRSLRMSFNPPFPPGLVPLKLVIPALNTLAFASLPRWARKLYGAPGSAVTDRATTVALRGFYQATRLAPARLRFTPTVWQARQIVREYERQQASDTWPPADDQDAHARPGPARSPQPSRAGAGSVSEGPGPLRGEPACRKEP